MEGDALRQREGSGSEDIEKVSDVSRELPDCIGLNVFVLCIVLSL